MEDHSEQPAGASGARLALGILACILLLCAVGGIHLAVQSFEEEARLAGSGASGSDYLGVAVGCFIALILLAPAVPSPAAAVLAVRPVRASLVAAQATTGLWWTVWTLMLIIAVSDASIDRIVAMPVLALPPVLFTVCIHRIGRSLEGA